MNILYLNSGKPPSKELYSALQLLGNITDTDISEALEPKSQVRLIIKQMSCQIDLIASDGEVSWLASHVGALVGIPFVVLNPSFSEPNSLPLAENGCGILLFSHDHKTNANKKQLEAIHKAYNPRKLENTILKNDNKLAKIIKDIYERAVMVYGLN